MKNKNINKKSLIYNEIFPHRKSVFRIEKDYSENFPKINSKYFSPSLNHNESKISLKNNLLTNRTHKKSNNKKFFLNIKNISIEEKKNNINNNNIIITENNYNHNFQTLNNIMINNLLKKKRKNDKKNILNKLKEKDSDNISSPRNLESNILENNKISFKNKILKDIKNIEINANLDLNNNITNKFKNVGINTKLSKTISSFHNNTNNIINNNTNNNTINNNVNNNKIIFSYKTKEANNKNNINNTNINQNPKHKYKFIYSRNDNNIRTILSSNENKTIDNRNNNSNNYNNTSNNFRNKIKVNNVFFKLLSNNIVRKVELNDQMNNKISDEYVQNLLSKEIEQIKETKTKKLEMDKLSNLNNDELFQNSKIKKHFTLKAENLEKSGYKNNVDYRKKYNNFNNINEQKKENINPPYLDQKMILELFKQFDLHTEIQMFDQKYLKKNNKLEKLYLENKKELLNDKEVIKELARYFFNNSQNKNNKNKKESKYKDQMIMTEFNQDKNIYTEEEKNIIKDIIYQLSDDLNENLESYKNVNKNNNNENSINHVINSISLAQLFEKLNKGNSNSQGKRRRFNKMIMNKTEENNYSINNKLNNNFFKGNNKDNNDQGNNIINNKELLNDILLNFLGKNKTSINNNMKNDNYNGETNDKDNNDNENQNSENILNNLLNIMNNSDGGVGINSNLFSDEVKQALANILQNNKSSSSTNIQNNSNINSKSFNKSSINTNTNKAENNKSPSKNKDKDKKHKKTKRKKKGKNQAQILAENNETKNQDLILNSDNIDLDLQDKSLDFSDDFDDNIDNDDILKTPSNKKNNINGTNKEKELNLNLERKINKSNNKKSILSLKNNQSQNNLTKTEKGNKNVRFSVPKQSLFNSINNKEMKNGLKINLNPELNTSNSFIDVDSPKRYKTNLDLRQNNNNNAFPFDNINNESFLDENDLNEIHSSRKYSTKTTSIAKKTTRVSLMESLSKIRKKKFQKTRKDKSKNKNLVTIKNEENNKNKNEEEIIDIREEMLNRKLKNFFGKIKMLKNADINNYDEQLKMFIDNEIDKLNDWETKEQEMRINNFFSDLRLIKYRATVGGDIKYANPIKFSSTWTNFSKFQKKFNII